MKASLLRYGRWAVLLVAAYALPFVFVSGPARLLAITALLYAMLAVSWNLTLGFAGIFNFAHVGFFGVGGYTMAILTVTAGWNPWLALPCAAVTGAVAGAAAYLPVVRMRGIYIALITFVFVQLCFYLVLATPGVTGGSNGLPGVPWLELGTLVFGQYGGLGYLWMLGATLALLLIGLEVLLRLPFGRSLIALRDNEQLAVSRGVPRVRQQLLAFMVSGALAGVTGALYVSYFRVADGTLFSFGFVTFGLSMIFLGGTRQTWGPALGAVLVTLLNHQLSDAGAWRDIVIGAGTIVVLIFLPGGLAGLLRSALALGHRPRGSRSAKCSQIPRQAPVKEEILK